jgi:hypothetical protein
VVAVVNQLLPPKISYGADKRTGRHAITINMCMPIPKLDLLFNPDQSVICSYGCGLPANYRFINSGKVCCSRVHNSCPSNKKKNSEGLKKTGRDYKSNYKNLSQDIKDKMAWARGLTQEDSRVAKFAQNNKGKRRISDKIILEKAIYREQCNFNLAGIIQKIKGFNLLEKHGMYSKSNPDGVVRDHRLSVNYGYLNNIDPKIISHPTNCEFLQHKDNARKTFKNSITLEELIEGIQNWCI